MLRCFTRTVPERPVEAGWACGGPSGMPFSFRTAVLEHVRALEFPLVPESNLIARWHWFNCILLMLYTLRDRSSMTSQRRTNPINSEHRQPTAFQIPNHSAIPKTWPRGFGSQTWLPRRALGGISYRRGGELFALSKSSIPCTCRNFIFLSTDYSVEFWLPLCGG
jgi:hypothetical protein